MAHPFIYQAPTVEQRGVMETLTGYFADAYDVILMAVPASAERTLAIRKLQEARMWANAAVLGVTIQ